MLRFLAFAILTLATIVNAECTAPRQRKEWLAFSDSEKADYISAVLCLHDTAPVTGYKGSTSKFEDFAGTHIIQVNYIHGVGQFLPWQHRYILWAYESALIEDCGYSGAQPYWNETKDAGAFTKSPLFQANDLSFGGDGDPNNFNCISTGPFANITLHIGPGSGVSDHCLARAISDRSSYSAGQAWVDACLAKPDYSHLWPCLAAANGIHGAGHAGVGAEMLNSQSSILDPIFYMHHGWIDKLWYDWQQADPTNRTYDIAGCTTIDRTCAQNTTLSFGMTVDSLAPDVTVGDVMNTTGDFLCYEYV
ncbi:hypothetical protein DL96DRAFT_1819856 [Flagelloscypha sp. PMI_526]|nr:hypothetical protein DL96DRAFT_1819856 [Flagelloscypha sp. PMI_526]